MIRVAYIVVLTIAGCGRVNLGAIPDGPGGSDQPGQITDGQPPGSMPTVDAPPGSALLSITVGGGAGTITSIPSGITCGSTCTAAFPVGTSVQLIATTGLTGWSGACSGSSACTVLVDDATTVGATFCANGNETFVFTGALQTLSRPSCAAQLTVDVQGAGGGAAFIGTATTGTGGLGGRVQATIPIASTDVIYVYVGGVGGDSNGTAAATAGFNGGGAGAADPDQGGGGGGGASDLRLDGTALANRIVIAGGGGGAASCGGVAAVGGLGGGLTGGNPAIACGTPTTAATGGTPSAGGVGGSYAGFCTANNGAPGVGADACNPSGGGGAGGGYYGGGGGAWMGGGGGSSYAAANATNVVHTQGFKSGVGSVTISW